MNRVEFMRQLERLLRDIPESDRLDAIAYYNDYFDEAGVENEAQVIRELGSPEKVAAIIKANSNMEGSDQTEKQKRGIPWPILIILIIFASPILLGVGGGLLGGLVGLVVGLFGIIIAVVACGAGLSIGGVVCLAVGIFRVFISPFEGLITMGVGGVLGAVGILFVLLSVWIFFKWLPALFRTCVNFCQKIFHRGERGDIA